MCYLRACEAVYGEVDWTVEKCEKPNKYIHHPLPGTRDESGKKRFFIAFYITELLFPQQSELNYLTSLGSIN